MNGKRAKRIFYIAVAALILVGMGSCAVSCFMDSAIMYAGLDEITDGAAVGVPHKYRKVCYLRSYTLSVNENADKTVWTIPDYCGEHRIENWAAIPALVGQSHSNCGLKGFILWRYPLTWKPAL